MGLSALLLGKASESLLGQKKQKPKASPLAAAIEEFEQAETPEAKAEALRGFIEIMNAMPKEE